jgi:hypothetical protein
MKRLDVADGVLGDLREGLVGEEGLVAGDDAAPVADQPLELRGARAGAGAAGEAAPLRAHTVWSSRVGLEERCANLSLATRSQNDAF